MLLSQKVVLVVLVLESPTVLAFIVQHIVFVGKTIIATETSPVLR